MATVNGLTKEAMLALADANIVGGDVVNDRLILTKRDGSTVDAGIVKGDPGAPGAAGVGPTGSIALFAGAAAPAGHLLCDGSAVSRTTYSALYNVIGTTYGAGDATTTFNLPNLKGRVPVGLDAADTLFDALGESGGAKTHTLSAAEMPAHTHTQNSHNHAQDPHNHTQDLHDHPADAHAHGPASLTGFMTYGTVSRSRVAAGTSTSPIAITATDSAHLGIFNTVTDSVTVNPQGLIATNQAATAANQAATATNQSTGSSGAHNNLQPYLVLNYIIKT